jgi:uncharacterized membrane protein
VKSKAAIANHPLHPMLVTIPAGAFIMTLVLDIIYAASGQALWWLATLPVILLGVIGGLVAAIPGLVDLVAVAPHQNARRVALTHMALNIALVALFAWNGYTRWTADAPPEPGATHLGFWLSLIGVAILAVSGWLGWAMVYEYHMGVLEHPESKDEKARRPGEAA